MRAFAFYLSLVLLCSACADSAAPAPSLAGTMATTDSVDFTWSCVNRNCKFDATVNPTIAPRNLIWFFGDGRADYSGKLSVTHKYFQQPDTAWIYVETGTGSPAWYITKHYVVVPFFQ